MGSGFWPPPGGFYTPDPGPAPDRAMQDGEDALPLSKDRVYELLEELSVLLPQMSAIQDRANQITRLLLDSGQARLAKEGT